MPAVIESICVVACFLFILCKATITPNTSGYYEKDRIAHTLFNANFIQKLQFISPRKRNIACLDSFHSVTVSQKSLAREYSQTALH